MSFKVGDRAACYDGMNRDAGNIVGLYRDANMATVELDDGRYKTYHIKQLSKLWKFKFKIGQRVACNLGGLTKVGIITGRDRRKVESENFNFYDVSFNDYNFAQYNEKYLSLIEEEKKPEIKTAPFDLEAALLGEPVMMVDGTKVELDIEKTKCYLSMDLASYPVAGKYLCEGEVEFNVWTKLGHWYKNRNPDSLNLVMAPKEKKKKTLWANVYKTKHNGKLWLGEVLQSREQKDTKFTLNTNAYGFVKTISFEVEE
jgi:hypothetical protein